MTMRRLAELVQTHKAMGHPVRLRILAMLRTGPLCVCQMTAVVKLAASTVSEHLSQLRRSGLVLERKEGRWVEYRLADSAAPEGVLAMIWAGLEDDPDVQADAMFVSALRQVPVVDLCGANLDLSRVALPRLATAVTKAGPVRAPVGPPR